jgi:hypothetical protein
MPRLAITTGINELLKEKEAYWFADIISSYLPTLKQQNETFAIAILNVEGNQANFILCRDVSMNGEPEGIYANKRITYTDYPDKIIKFFVGLADTSNGVWTYTLMLPEEY